MKTAIALLVSAHVCAVAAFAAPRITMLPAAKALRGAVPEARLARQLEARFASEDLREIKAQPIVDADGRPAYLLVHLLSKRYHRLELVRVEIDAAFRLRAMTRDYEPRDEDFAQQKGGITEATCPDDTIEFIALCPNNDTFEQGIAKEAADAARTHGLATVELLDKPATRQAWMNYMACPKLRGNFYDGDSNKSSIEASDGLISYKEISQVLKSKWNYAVTNLWVACQAFNDPMHSAVVKDAQAKKYAAGINNLLVGPSDKAAACSIKAWLDGAPMTAAFDDCYKRFDTTEDKWGFGGDGSDQF